MSSKMVPNPAAGRDENGPRQGHFLYKQILGSLTPSGQRPKDFRGRKMYKIFGPN